LFSIIENFGKKKGKSNFLILSYNLIYYKYIIILLENMAQLFKKNILKEKIENFSIPNFEDKINTLQSWHNLYIS
jgi:hypothetical protein